VLLSVPDCQNHAATCRQRCGSDGHADTGDLAPDDECFALTNPLAGAPPLRRRDDCQQREQPRRARPSARVPSKPTVQHVGQPRQATAVMGRSASEIGPTTPTRMIVRTATARPTAPLERCSQSEPLASGERRVVAAADGTSHIVDISFRYVRMSRADHVRPRQADFPRRRAHALSATRLTLMEPTITFLVGPERRR
jgi:hypothetical protein